MDRHADPRLTLSRAEVEQTIQARFETVVRRAAARTAMKGDGRSWTYDDLNREANRVAHAIQRRRASRAGPVVYVLPQSPAMVTAALGILKAGHPYLALPPRMPDEAMREILDRASPVLIVTDQASEARAARTAPAGSRVLSIEEALDDGPVDDPVSTAGPSDPASIFFTSGTTGRPKGVVRSHRVVVHRAWLTAEQEHVHPGDCRSLLTHTSFAAAQADFGGALLLGTTLAVFDVVPVGLDRFADWIDEAQITVLRPPVQLFRRLTAGIDPARRFESVRLVSLGGDAVQAADVDAWKQHFPRPCVLIYRFSSTETTLLTSAHLDHDSDAATAAQAVGYVVADREIAIVDEHGVPVAAGESGELVVTSDWLADGYLGAPEETAERFGPSASAPARRSYRTGDIGHIRRDGQLVFEGRRDQLVKIRGYRVSLREVEAAMRSIAGVVDAVAVVAGGVDAARLVAFVVIDAAQATRPTDVRQRLQARLPDWKVPAVVRAIDMLPTTPNGKVDRLRLVAMAEQADRERDAELAAAAAPADALERQVAAIVEGVLGRGPVGRDEDFFTLGGDSLQATVLHQRIQRDCAVVIPLQALVKDATVRGLADAVRATRAFGRVDARPPLIVPLRTDGDQVPVFLVHGRLGQAFVSPHFLAVFGDNQPVYAFQATGLDLGGLAAVTIEAMAAEYVRGMRQLQPSGPYRIFAACVGAMVAVEMAHQLARAGEAVAPLVFIDPPVKVRAERSWWSQRWRRTRWALKRLVGRGRASEQTRLQRRVAQGRVALDTTSASDVEAAIAAVQAFEAAREKYRDWRYDGPVLMLRSADRLQRDGPTRRGPFSRHLTGPVQWFDVGGRHGSVRDANNERLGQALRQALDITAAAIASDRRSSS